MPPARLKQLQKQIEDKSSAAYQRLAWETLKKRLNGLVNKVNALNLKPIVVELFRENLLRGRGLLARSLMKAQAAALPFTPIYAAVVAVLNTKLPEVGDLVLARVVAAFRKAYKRNDKVSGFLIIDKRAERLMLGYHIRRPVSPRSTLLLSW